MLASEDSESTQVRAQLRQPRPSPEAPHPYNILLSQEHTKKGPRLLAMIKIIQPIIVVAHSSSPLITHTSVLSLLVQTPSTHPHQIPPQHITSSLKGSGAQSLCSQWLTI